MVVTDYRDIWQYIYDSANTALRVNLVTGSVTVSSGTVTANQGTSPWVISGAVTTQARINTTDTITSFLATNSIMNGTTALTPIFAFANIAASQTDSNIISAVALKKIRVLSLICITGATATNITFNTKPTIAGSAISMLFANAANGGAVLPFSPIGWFETSIGEGLTATTGAGSTTGVQVVYVTI